MILFTWVSWGSVKCESDIIVAMIDETIFPSLQLPACCYLLNFCGDAYTYLYVYLTRHILRIFVFFMLWVVCMLGPVTPSPILLFSWPDDLYTIQNRNPKFQPYSPVQSDKQALPSLPYLDFQVGQARQSLLEKLSRPIWLLLNCYSVWYRDHLVH